MHDLWKRSAEKEVAQARNTAVVAPEEPFPGKDTCFPFKLIHKENIQSRASLKAFCPFHVSKALL